MKCGVCLKEMNLSEDLQLLELQLVEKKSPDRVIVSKNGRLYELAPCEIHHYTHEGFPVK